VLAQAVILCGGMGTRLGPLTATTPKPMLEVGGRPFLDHLLSEVVRFGCEEVLLLAGNLGGQIHQHYHGTRFGRATIKVLVEPEPRGTAGALDFALPQLAAEFLLLNGDSWIDFDLVKLALAWRDVPWASVLMLLQHVPDAARFGAVDADDNVVRAFREKDPTRRALPGWINSGVYVVRRCVLEGRSGWGEGSLERDLLPDLVAKGQVAAHRAPEGSYFIDIGVPDSLAQARADLPRRRRRPAIFFDRDGTLNHDTGHTHRVEDLRWISGAMDAIRIANEAGFFVFVVTNQSGIARGLYSQDDVLAFHQAMQRQLFSVGAHMDDIAWCPHHPQAPLAQYRQACDCRKPAGGLLKQLMGRWDVDAAGSLMVGDKDTDVSAGAMAGVRSLKLADAPLDQVVRQHIETISRQDRHVD
jgi:D,D-heptose 1,7-bisphosphate phosphatase